jgi:hypothetical protein
MFLYRVSTGAHLAHPRSAIRRDRGNLDRRCRPRRGNRGEDSKDEQWDFSHLLLVDECSWPEFQK